MGTAEIITNKTHSTATANESITSGSDSCIIFPSPAIYINCIKFHINKML